MVTTSDNTATLIGRIFNVSVALMNLTLNNKRESDLLRD